MPSSNPRYRNYTARVKLRRRILHEESHCGICGLPVDKTLTMVLGKHGKHCHNPDCPGCSPHPMRPEIDEIIPISRGGSPTDRQNTRLVHRQCNRRRGTGNKTIIQPLTTTRTWSTDPVGAAPPWPPGP